jgi:hypothetical protein
MGKRPYGMCGLGYHLGRSERENPGERNSRARAACPDESGSRPSQILTGGKAATSGVAWPTPGRPRGAPLRPGAGAAHQALVTQALLPVSYGTARCGAVRRTARSGCATMAVPAMIGHGRDPDSSGQAARATWRGASGRSPKGRRVAAATPAAGCTGFSPGRTPFGPTPRRTCGSLDHREDGRTCDPTPRDTLPHIADRQFPVRT